MLLLLSNSMSFALIPSENIWKNCKQMYFSDFECLFFCYLLVFALNVFKTNIFAFIKTLFLTPTFFLSKHQQQFFCSFFVLFFSLIICFFLFQIIWFFRQLWFCVKIFGEISCQSWLLWTQLFNCCIVQCDPYWLEWVNMHFCKSRLTQINI